MNYAETFMSLEDDKQYGEDFKKIPLREIHEAAIWLKNNSNIHPQVLYFEVINQIWLSGKFSEKHAPKISEMLQRAIVTGKQNDGSSK